MFCIRKQLMGVVMLTCAVGFIGCDSSEPTTEVRQAPPSEQAAPQELSTETRLGLQPGNNTGNPHAGMEMPPAMKQPAAQPESEFSWTAPDSWIQGPPKMMRLVTYYTSDAKEAECYITLLNGTGGGVAANINRWVSQMGQEPLSEEALAALPKLSILGKEAPLVNIAGNFTGMSGSAKSGYRLLGSVCLLEDKALFIKLIGPDELVAGELDNFKSFCESIQ